jgi:hypothetical protein
MSEFKQDYYSWGAYTFASVFDTLGMGKDFPPGMFEESGYYGDVFQTNIFTVFRGLIYDFGVAGSLLALFALSLVVHAFTHRMLLRPRSWLAVTVYVEAVVFLLAGYLFSIFVARYAILNAVGVFVLLAMNQRLTRTRPAAPTHLERQAAA